MMPGMSGSGRYEELYRIGVELSAEKNRHRLVERILIAAKQFSQADGGTLYLVDEDAGELRFTLVRTDSLGLAYGGAGQPPPSMPPVPLYREDNASPNLSNVVSRCFHEKSSVNIVDAYEVDGYDFSGTKAFDARTGYRSKSFLTIPMLNADERVIGVLQLINCLSLRGEVLPFSSATQEAVEALAFQAAIALDNQMLLEQQKKLLESFIKLIAAAIDAKSPYTGGHCRRVPALTEMLAEAVCGQQTGAFADFDLTEEEWYELHIAGWLHDCGKITTPVHVMDKATKLEAIFDRIELLRTRLAVLRQQVLQSTDVAERQARLNDIGEAMAFLERVNRGGEFLADEDAQRIRELATWTWEDAAGRSRPLLDEEEQAQLSIRKGTLTEDERLVINGHMVETIRMLQALPFPPNLRRVPEYAGGHHERMDGQGYPKGLYAGDMSIPARIMAIADVFEALTASDRPYKPGMPLSQAMDIMGRMKRNNHLDPALFDVFVTSGVYRRYAEQFLRPEQLDGVDESSLLAIHPQPVSLPPELERRRRWEGFLPAYEAVARTASYDLPSTRPAPSSPSRSQR
jgi:HD-GYP domain-containing protein (c-di-GMP phosphodiesterase class II)